MVNVPWSPTILNCAPSPSVSAEAGMLLCCILMLSFLLPCVFQYTPGAVVVCLSLSERYELLEGRNEEIKFLHFKCKGKEFRKAGGLF